jgi:hypothetical protein
MLDYSSISISSERPRARQLRRKPLVMKLAEKLDALICDVAAIVWLVRSP